LTQVNTPEKATIVFLLIGITNGEKMEPQLAERIARALEHIVEKLGSIETKLEELSLEVQAQGGMICDAISPTIEECDN
jgi:hypothetical protein